MSIATDAWASVLALPGWVHKLLLVLLVLLVGWLADLLLDRYLARVLRRNKHLDRTSRRFLVRTVDIGVWLLTAVVALAVLGVDPAALAGGAAVTGFVVGFAVKDTLGNLAAGFMLLLLRPFNVDDTVTLDGQSGDIVAIGAALTTMKTADGRIVTITNGRVLAGTIINHTREDARRADVLVGIHYDDDIDVAVKAILDAVKADPRVLSEPAPSVRITTLGDNAVGLQVRPWVATSDYWQAQADFHGTVKRALVAAGCSIPYPQREVHVTHAPGE